MRSMLRSAVVLLAVLHVVTGVVYPLVVTGIAHLVWPEKAHGSIVRVDGRDSGSALIGQPFSAPGYFWGRPSATAPVPYSATASSGSNLGPTNPALLAAVRDRVASLRGANSGADDPVPVDLVTASASGLDPHISVAAALFQADRVAAARALPADRVRRLVAEHREERTWGFLGEPRVNVLLLNLALDGLDGEPTASPKG